MKNKIQIEKLKLEKIDKKTFNFIKKSLPGISLSQWKWEYLNSNCRGYCFLAKINGILVSHNSFIINQFLLNNKKILVAKSEGSFADLNLIEDIMGKKVKVFREVVKEALKVMKKENIYLAYGFPNNLGHKSYAYGGYRLEEINIFISNLIINFNYYFYKKRKSINLISKIFLKVINFLWKSIVISILLYFNRKKITNIKVVEKKNFKDIEVLFKKVIKKLPKNYLMVFRSASYINWRYKNNPHHKYFIYGYYNNNVLEGLIVFNTLNKKKYKNIEIKDLLFINKNVKKYLLSYIFKWCIDNKISVATLWEDQVMLKKYNKYSLIMSGFLRNRLLIKKILIKSILNKKTTNKNIILELKKYLERT
ncbi:MAG: hypothetical protein CMJ08_06985 [Pelagibacterales bacterium]|nr:hypothetical protein [Pelagibacterales bacterium]|tara:strand:- start:1073 stop:2167 length:1095 start_codon:yes stop_codon:yes gene_type:complete